ncbi:MAG: ABC transporter permease [bacterium]|nr:ABC transporter permease [bacterium]
MIHYFGKKITGFISEWGNISYLGLQVIKCITTGKRYIARTISQMTLLGINSLPITVITSMFVSMAFTLQIVREFLRFGAGEMIGGVVAIGVWRELAPLLTAVVVAGRVGAAISAELGTMKVTEQVEALEAMSQNPIEYLVVPRMLACAIMMPLLVGIADIVGFFSGFIVAFASGRVNPYGYFISADRMLYPVDIYGGLIKGFFFGIAIVLISSFMGLNASAGAKGVGDMTTRAVVVSLIAVFVLNYLLSVVIF